MNSRVSVSRQLGVLVFLLTTAALERAASAYAYADITQTSSNVGYDLPLDRSLAQSFTAVESGRLTHVGICTNGGNFDISIHAGAGDTGAVLYSQRRVFFANKAPGTPDIVALTSSIPVTKGQVYTLKITNVAYALDNRLVHSENSATDRYLGGRRYTLGGPDNVATADMVFAVRVTSDVEVLGNDVVITGGDVAESTADGTDFGSVEAPGARVASRTFTVKNVSGRTLALSGATMQSGSQYRVTKQPATSLANNGTTTLTVEFDPTSTGRKADSVVLTTDGGPNPYKFQVGGTGIADTTKPTVAITGSTGTVGGLFNAMIQFSELVTGFTSSDISCVNCTVSAVSDPGDGRYVARINPVADGQVRVSVLADKAVDVAGLGNTASNTFTVTANLSTPTPVITGPTTIQKGPFQITIDFGETVTGFAVADIRVTNGSAGTVSGGSQGRYTTTVTPTQDGIVTVRLNPGAASDSGSNASAESNVLSVNVDLTRPKPVLVGPSTPQRAQFSVSIDFDETVAGFALADLAVTNGVAANLVDLGNGAFSVGVTPSADGTTTVSIAANAATDTAGNTSLASTPLEVRADLTAPAPTITGPAGPVEGAFVVTIAFGEETIDFAVGDLSVTNGTASDLKGTEPGVYTATITPSAGGEVVVALAAGAATDVAGNPSAAAVDFEVEADLTSPPTTITGPETAQAGPFVISIFFGEAVTGFVAGDIDVVNGELTSFVDVGGGLFRATVAPVADGLVSVSVAAGAAADAATRPNSASNVYSVEADLTAPTPAITGPSGTQTAPFEVVVDFGESVAGFGADDLVLVNGSVATFSDGGSGRYVVTIAPTTDGTTTVRVLAGVAMDVGAHANGPSNTFSTAVDITRPRAVVEAPAAPRNEPFLISIAFGELVTGFAVEGIAISNGVVSNLAGGGDGAFTALVTPIADGTVDMFVTEGAAIDEAGLPSIASETRTVLADQTAPAATISGPDALVGGPFAVTVAFGEAVSGFALTDLVVGNGTATELSSSETGYTVTIEPSADGSVSVNLAAGAVTDAAGNENTAALEFSVAADVTAPRPAISGPTTHQTGPFDVTIAFGEAVTGFALEDIVVGNGTASNLVDRAGGAFAVTITAAGDGDVTVVVAAGAAVDGAGHPSIAGSEFRVLTASCGDGVANAAAGEACDDANTVDGDGCSASCTVEVPTEAGADAGGCGCSTGSDSAFGALLLGLAAVFARRRPRSTVSG